MLLKKGQPEMKTAAQAVDYLNARMKTDFPASVPLARGEVIDRASTEGYPLVALTALDGHYRVLAAVAYLNRAQRPQVGIYLQDFDDPDEALERYMWVLEMNGHVAFGDYFRLSNGSGLRHVETIDEPTSFLRIRK